MLRVALSLAVLLAPLPATAQDVSQFAEIQVVFEGVVANDPTGTIQIRQTDGSLAPWNGPIPDYPLRTGEAVRISFDARVPRPAAFAAGGVYAGQLSSDGLYRFDLLPPVDDLAGVLAGGVTNVRQTVPLRSADALGQRAVVGMTLIYNAQTDSYAIDWDARPARFGVLDGPGFVTNADLVLPAPSTCAGGIAVGCAAFGNGGFTLTGVRSVLDALGIPIYPEIAISEDFRELADQVPTGVFDLRIAGNWTLGAPQVTPPPEPGPIDVPEPAPLALFAMAVGALVWRGRNAPRWGGTAQG